MGRAIAFLDFDGTITTKDTLAEIIKFHKGKTAYYIGLLLNSPFLIAYKAGLLRNDIAKQMLLRYFFRNTTLESFQKKCDEFAERELPALIRAKALKEIDRLKQLGFEIVVVSASAENWTKKWCDQQGIKNISTKLHTNLNRITGRIEGKNCYGDEKVERICSAYDLASYDEVYCYGDTKGDKPMLRLATRSFYKPFR